MPFWRMVGKKRVKKGKKYRLIKVKGVLLGMKYRVDDNDAQACMVMEGVPAEMTDNVVLEHLYGRDIDWRYFSTIKNLTGSSDSTISDWLNLSVKTLREYRKPGSTSRENIKEHVIILLTLIKHGIRVFGSKEAFQRWISAPNFHFDGRSPSSFLNTVTGIKFVNDRLTAMEYGDNV